jgi:uncharacterized lipoprotein YmbA
MHLSASLARLAVAFLLLPLAACSLSSPPATFFTLTPLVPEPSAIAAPRVATRTTIALGPVEIADYLARPEIVTRSSANTLKIAATERWGGTLRNNVVRTLLDNFGLLLGPAGCRIVAWESPVPADYRIALTIARFEKDETGKVILEADWLLFAEPGSRIAAAGSSRFVESVAGESYSATVVAMGHALALLSRELAMRMEKLLAAP